MMISLNKVNVTGCPADEYERVYKQASDYMATQPGHISQLFLRSENHPGTYFAVALWESVEHYTALAGIDELVAIFDQVISLNDPDAADGDKITVEHHKPEVVYAENTLPDHPTGAMVCVNRISVTGISPEEYERVYREGSDYMARRPGHIRHKLVRSTTEPDVYFSIAEWTDVEAYRALDELDELTAIFAQVNDKIEIENHECVVRGDK
ncbi:antibiotic biosynthesis monooxygenase [Lentzea sp. BCCO 10_0798]|uniref:Antibiotic biosynthesis monooxygenase n=1 Tax=Lentzea kristufekii TaxID=3095430 RepID=A0ABU4TYB2_9PSEU|nr:antibiotic biosynthesis monooxygenase [Lentzea sp. BCCO 10_0798]MDX8053053.1 antibiotic biosynthesis monooxygenase [Lentzea sp. BCCO 10_0798]